MYRRAGLASHTLVVAVLASCGRPAGPQPPVECELVAQQASDADYPALFATVQAPLVVVGASVWRCDCGPRASGGDTQGRALGGGTQDRALGGATQDRALGGATQDRELGGDAQDRALGGATQDRELGGATQDRELGGATQDRELGGDAQDRALGGGVQAPMCRATPGCPGFELIGFRTARYFDGVAVRDASTACVP